MTLRNLLLTTCIAGALSACGGGGSGGSGADSSSPPVTPVTPVTPDPATPVPVSTLTISGTAASGKAIGGAPVSAKCLSGTGNATSAANGAYSVVIANGQLPCMLEITKPVDGVKMHGVASGSASTVTANITPLTEMLAARTLRSEPTVFFAAFDGATANNLLTAANLKTAQTDISGMFASTVNTSAIADFSASALQAATADNPGAGDAHDKVLDALNARLSAPQLTQVVSALTRNGSAAELRQTLVDLTDAPPVANAGVAQSVVAGAFVTLDASASSAAAGRGLTYAWVLASKPAGSTAVLTAASSAKPNFTADVAGAYMLTLIVSDGRISSATAAVTINVSKANAAPVANAGVAQNVLTGTLVVLDGSASSDANNDALSYRWLLTARPAASNASLNVLVGAKPVLSVDVAGVYVASLVVNDGKLDSAVATVSITATVLNVAPVANAGNAQNVIAGATVTLDGTKSSDANGDKLGYAWSLTSKPAGSTAALSAPSNANPAFIADMAGIYVASLTVSDGKLASTISTVTVTAAQANVAPVANAGEAQNVTTTTVVKLNGAASSDANGDRLSYQWRFVSRPVFSTTQFDDATAAAPSFKADREGTYVIGLVVNDGLVNSAAVQVTVSAVAKAYPVAAGTGLIVQSFLTFQVLDEKTMQASLASSCGVSFDTIEQRPDGVLIGMNIGGIYEIDVNQPVCISKGNPSDWFRSFAIDANSQYWAVSRTSEIINNSLVLRLHKITADGKSTGSVLLSGATKYVTGMDFHPNGDLLGIGIVNSGKFGLVKINTSTGVTTLISEMSEYPTGDIDVDQNGTIRGIRNGEMLYISSTTGALIKKVAMSNYDAGASIGAVVFVK